MSNTDKLVHGGTRHILGDDDGAGHTENLAEARLAVLISDLAEVFLCVWECAGHRAKGDEGEVQEA